MTHATQQAGKYPLTWDGTDQQGAGVPLGKYKIWVEVAAEHGPYSAKFAVIDCGLFHCFSDEDRPRYVKGLAHIGQLCDALAVLGASHLDRGGE